MLARRLSLFALLMLVPGCFTGSGRLETRSFALDDFDSIDAARYVEVDVQRGDAFTVTVTADDNLWGELAVRRDGHTLVIALSDAHPIYENVTVRAVVTMPTLAAVSVSGGAHGTLSGFDDAVPTLTVHGSGGSTVEGDASAEDLSVELSGGSRIVLVGSAETLSVDASGNSVVDLLDVEVSAAAVTLSGGSHGVVSATGRLDYHLSGGSHLDYAGDPELGRQETSGGSDASPR